MDGTIDRYIYIIHTHTHTHRRVCVRERERDRVLEKDIITAASSS